jgi:hypothetical protein
MIGSPMRWAAIAVLSSLLPAATLEEAATDLGRRLRAGIPRGEPFRFSVHSLVPDEGARILVDGTLRRILGTSRGDSGTVAIDVTLSRNLETSLLVAEMRRGDSRVVAIVPYDAHPVAPRPAVRLEARQLVRHSGPGRLLDLAPMGDRRLLLDTAAITLVDSQGVQAVFELPAIRWPRDSVARLVADGGSFVARLPGMTCRGPLGLAGVRCDADDSPWILPGGITGSLQPGRNFFLQDGGAVSFFSAIRMGDAWIAAHVDGRLRLHAPSAAPIELAGDFGSFIAVAPQSCEDVPLALATSMAGTAVRAFRLDRKLIAASEPVDLGGEVSSLWDDIAIVRVPAGETIAYRIEVRCVP